MPLGALNFEGCPLHLRARLAARLLANLDKREWVPRFREAQAGIRMRCLNGPRAFPKRRKDRVIAHAMKPVGRIGGIRLLAV